MKKPLLIIVSLILFSGVATAQTAIVNPDYDVPTKIAPAYFGPNAFPVPDMLDGRTSSKLKFGFYGDCYLGTTTGRVADDVTGDLSVKLTIPLFTPKVNLSVWMPLFEAFHTSAELNTLRRLPEPYSTSDLRGMDVGDLYVSTDVQILNQERHKVDMTARAALKTASANEFPKARCYDAPGYFFDVAVGRGFEFSKESNLRLAVSTGLLCWQTDNGRQNDAVMYGVMVKYRLKRWEVDATFGGYVGWENDGDRPMTLKANLSYHIDNLSLRLGYQVGFHDWPYHQIRVGASYAFDVLGKTTKNR